MIYRSFDLQLFDYVPEPGAGRFRVRVAASPAGEQRLSEAEEVTLPRDLRQRLRRLERRQLEMPEMIALGEALGAALFPPRARTFLYSSQAMLAPDERLRIRLRAESYVLADLPWEYAYVPPPDMPSQKAGAEGFLVLDRRLSLVRHEGLVPLPSPLHRAEPGPLRLVALLASPDEPGYPPIDLDLEQSTIEQALGKVSEIEAEFWRDATVDTLEEAFASKADILHFVGHLQVELGQAHAPTEGEGYVVLRGDQQQPKPLRAEELALLLVGHGVRLVVLGPGETGRRDEVSPWLYIVPKLIRAGIPAVVAMQYRLLDRNTLAFRQRFYRALAAGEAIDRAVTDGRLAIFMRGGGHERDWGVPVVYMRGEEGTLFLRATEALRHYRATERIPREQVPVNRMELRQVMLGVFSSAELAMLCRDVERDLTNAGVDLSVNLDIVGGTTKVERVVRLIQYLDRRGYLSHLAKAVRSARPGII